MEPKGKIDRKNRINKRIAIFFTINLTLTGILIAALIRMSSVFSLSGHQIDVTTGIITSNFLYLGLLALLFGLRHSVDADHIAAIDTSTRKLMGEGKNSEFSGFFFSLGHSTVVFSISLLLMASTRYVLLHLPSMERIGSFVGPVVSSAFLFIMAAINITILLGLRTVLKKLIREKSFDRDSLDSMLGRMGVMNRFLRVLFSTVKSQYYLYPIGLLFGLGFDTASEVIVLSISATLAGLFVQIPLYALLIFPSLFTLGMTLVDTTDGYMMCRAYRWAISDPVKKLWYNMVLTAASIVFAVVAGAFEVVTIATGYLHLTGEPWVFFVSISTSYWEVLGIAIISVFAGIVAISYIRFRKYAVAASAS